MKKYNFIAILIVVMAFIFSCKKEANKLDGASLDLQMKQQNFHDYLVNDFEDLTPKKPYVLTGGKNAAINFDTAKVSCFLFNSSIESVIDTSKACPSNKKYIQIEGVATWDWAQGSFVLSAKTNQGTDFFHAFNNNDLSNIYFNCYLGGDYSKYPQSSCSIQLTVLTPAGANVTYTLAIPINWTGWKLINLPLKYFTTGTVGAGALDPNRIVSIALWSLADPKINKTHTMVKVDRISFSEPSAYTPSN